MAPTLVKTEDKALEKTENEVAAVLVHLKKLLRLKNRLRSPLLRPAAETIVHILSYIVGDADHPSLWWKILSACRHIYGIMCTTAKL